MTRYLVLVMAALALSWSVWSLTRGGSTVGAARDEVVRAAGQQIAVLNSMDAANIDASVDRWLAVSTGSLHDSLASDRSADRARFRVSGVGKVTGLAVTALDVTAGRATVIASVRVHSGTDQRQRYQAGLDRTAGGWKLASLTAIPPAGVS